jgi:dimeric dUTPase (all-alpha-NTP-PPase superfamily)
MELQNIIDAQKALNARIIKEKGLEGKDLVANTFVALQVELAEFANEGRWFKHWSNDQKPRTVERVATDWDDDGTPTEWDVKPYKNPLLEEFTDSVHFFVSIAIQKGWEDVLWVYEEQVDPDEFSGDLTSYYLEMIYFINDAYIKKYGDEQIAGIQKNAFSFRMAWILFLNIGMNGFGFTWEQIYEAYFEKNRKNHQRQENGY